MSDNNLHNSKPSSREQRGKKAYYVYALPTIVLVLLSIFVLLSYFLTPFTTRWRALYGDIVYPEGYSIHGIDVSHHQGNINWEKVADAEINKEPVAFVVIKATEGKSFLDDNFNDNFFNARKYGLVRGAYHFFSPSVSGLEQAEHYLHHVHLDVGDMPPILDIEESGNLTPEKLRKEALTWLKEVEDCYGVPPIVYTGLKFKRKFLSTPEFDRYPFWIARYYVKEVDYEGPWRFWQHTDLGRIDGIKGPVDFDVYNGSMYDLRHLLLTDTDDAEENEDAQDNDDAEENDDAQNTKK